MCEMNALKMGITTTLGAAALTAGAIVGAVAVSGMGMAAASVALIVASVALGLFTLLSITAVIGGLVEGEVFNPKDHDSLKACFFFEFMGQVLGDILECVGGIFKKCCCSCSCPKKEKTVENEVEIKTETTTTEVVENEENK